MKTDTGLPFFGGCACGAVRYECMAPPLRMVNCHCRLARLRLPQANPGEGRRGTPYKGRPGLNHLAYEVEDAEAIRARLQAAGYRDATLPNAHPYRKRIYFYDPEGNDWEFVQYLSDDPRQRHDYELPDR